MPGVSPAVAREVSAQWILEINLGRVFRFAEKAVTITKEDGTEVHYSAGLAAFTLGTSIGAEASIGFSIDASVAVRSEPINWAVLVGEGIELEERPAVLRRHFPGQLLEESRVWLRGRTMAAEYGGPDVPRTEFGGRRLGGAHLAISVERRPTKGRTIPGPQERVDGVTWPVTALATVDDVIKGATYPIPIGAPGHNPSASFPDPGYPGLLVEIQAGTDDDRILIAGERVQAKAVELWDTTNNPWVHEKRTVKTMKDGLGRTISYIDFKAPVTLTAVAGNKYYIGMQADGGATYGGGIFDPRTGNLVRAAVDVIGWALQQNGTRVDFGRLEGLRQRLPHVFDGVINTPVVAFDWLRREILPLMDLIERQGELGLYYDIVTWDATEKDVTIQFNVDKGQVVQSAPLVRRRQGEIYNQFTGEFAQELVTGRFRRRRIVTGTDGVLGDPTDPGVVFDSRVIEDLRCALSQERFRTDDDRTGVRVAPSILARTVRDGPTMVRILKDRASRDALPKRVTQVTGGKELEFVSEGQIGLLTNTGNGLPGNIVRVDNVTVGDGQTVCDLTLLDDAIQTDRLGS